MTKRISLNLLLIVVLLTPAFEASAQTPAAESARPEPERRVGVQTSKRVSLTLREAVMMALENNRDIEIERLNARMNEFDLRAARGVYDPALTAGVFYDHSVTPFASLLAGGADGRLKTTDIAGMGKIKQRLPWQGGSVQAVFDQSRATSQNLFNSLNPQFTTSLSVEFSQPLFRDRRIDEPRRQIKIAKKRLDLSDSQFRQPTGTVPGAVARGAPRRAKYTNPPGRYRSRRRTGFPKEKDLCHNPTITQRKSFAPSSPFCSLRAPRSGGSFCASQTRRAKSFR
jgi:hypothetical protein